MIKYFRDEKSKLYHCITNHNLCLDGARKIGAVIVNLGAEDLMEGKPYLVFGLIWQIIKIGLLRHVSLEAHPELHQLREEGEDDLSNLPPEELLLKWMNYHLKKSGHSYQVTNFSDDIKNSEAYAKLMNRLAPELCSLEVLNECDHLKRAELILSNAEKMGCRTFLTPSDIISGNEKLNLAFTASMFNRHTGMAPIAEEMEQENESLQLENQSLQQANLKIKNEINMLAGELAQLRAEKKSLLDENQGLHRAVDDIKTANQDLSQKVQHLSGEKSSAERAREDLASQFEQVTVQLKQTAEELERERVSLETSEFCGASLASDLEELRSRHEKMEYLIEHLKIERMRSDMHIERLRVLYNWFPTTEALCEAIYKNLSLKNVQISATKSGYLTKKARNSNSWKYRYFVLRDNFLFYFKTDKDQQSQANGVIRVDDAVLRFAENPTRKDLKDQWLLCIEVPNNNDSIKQASFYIAGEDNELEGWKTAIKAAAGWWTKKSSLSSIKKSTRKYSMN